MKDFKEAQVWEDGLRTDPSKKSFEWWYFDANFEGGTTAVITFFTKQPAHASGPLNPQITVVITKPDKTKLTFTKYYPTGQFTASKEACNVTMGPNKVSGDLKTYTLHFDIPGLTGDLVFNRVAPSYSTAPEDKSKPEYFGWFPSIPYGTVKGSLTYEGKTQSLTGVGYHDHNWGLIDIKDVCQYWYWGRGNAGDYYMIFSVMILPKILGGAHASILYLAKKDKILIGDSNHLEMTRTDINPPVPKMGHLPTSLTFTYKNGSDLVEISLKNTELIESLNPLLGEPWWKKLLHPFDKPLYVRYNATLDLDINVDGKNDTQKGNGLYEIMILH